MPLILMLLSLYADAASFRCHERRIFRCHADTADADYAIDDTPADADDDAMLIDAAGLRRWD